MRIITFSPHEVGAVGEWISPEHRWKWSELPPLTQWRAFGRQLGKMSRGGRGAGCDLVKYEFELRINAGCDARLVERHRRRQYHTVRQIDRRGVREMAEAALLVFVASFVRVGQNHERERQQHRHSGEGQYPPNCCVLRHPRTLFLMMRGSLARFNARFIIVTQRQWPV